MCFICVFVLLTFSLSLLQPLAFMLHLNADVNLHFLCERHSELNSTRSSPKSQLFVALFHIALPFSFTSSDSVCLNLSPGPSSSAPLLPVSQRKSWIWTSVTGRTFMSSQELWNFSFASFPSPWCPSASSPTLWRQSVSEQLQPHSNCLFYMWLIQGAWLLLQKLHLN